jgi:hypothetical protein
MPLIQPINIGRPSAASGPPLVRGDSGAVADPDRF